MGYTVTHQLTDIIIISYLPENDPGFLAAPTFARGLPFWRKPHFEHPLADALSGDEIRARAALFSPS